MKRPTMLGGSSQPPPTTPRAEESAPITATGFVGRAKELERISKAIADAVAGHGRVLMLVGEPGIGKSRTTEELASLARARQARILSGRCHDGGGAPPFWPWRQIARSYVRQVGSAELTADLGARAIDVARVVDDLRPAFGGLAVDAEPGDPEEARFRLFDGFTHLLAVAARRRPLVLILDDLHWADPPSLLLLQFVARELAEIPMLIAGTYREIEVTGDPQRASILGSLSRERFFERIALGGLSTQEARALLRGDLGATPTDEIVDALFERTEGNPFFLREMARHLVEQRRSADGLTPQAVDVLEAPASVRAVLRQRLDRLNPETLHLLEVAAVVGRELDLAVLRLLEDEEGSSLLARLTEAAQAGILQLPTPASSRVRFSHSLVRDVLYEELPPDRRAELHRRVGAALEVHWRFDLTEHAGELALHFRNASTLGETQRALRYCLLAAERAASLLAYEDAVASYRHALDVVSGDPNRDDATHCRLLLGLGAAQAAASDVGHLQDTFRRAAEVARRLDIPEYLARAAIGYSRVPAIGGTVDDTSIRLLEEALERLPTTDSSLRAALLSTLADALHHSPDSYERRRALGHEASDMARRLGDLSTLARTLYDRHNALLGPDSLDDRSAAADELLRLARQTRDRPMLLRAHFCRVINLLEAALVPAASAEIAALEGLAKELREPWHHWYAAWFRAAQALMEGRLADGERLAFEAFEHGERVAKDNALQVFSAQIGMLRAFQGRWAEMVPAVRELVEQFPSMAAWRCALAYYCAESGQVEEARHHFELLARDGFRAIARDGAWMVSMSQLADVGTILDDAPRAAILYEMMAPFADRLTVVDRALASSGVVRRYLGALAITMRRWSEAETHLTHALRFHRTAGMRPWVVVTQIDLATLWTRQPAPNLELAQSTLAEAIVLAQELGLEGFLAKAENLRRRDAGAVPAQLASEPSADPGANVAPAPVDGMECVFRKEGDIWTLGYAGVTRRFKDARGLLYLAYLLRHPGRSFHVTELLSLAGGELPDRRPSRQEDASLGLLVDRLPSLDQRARAAYRQRLGELREALAEAEENNDPGAAARAQHEIEILVAELSGAVRGSTAGERARVSITKRLKAALARIRESHPDLARHLDATVKTGYFCSYTPDLRHPIDWNT